VARPPLIDRTTVLQTGLAIADERGVEAVTMHAVSKRLGVTPMALYRHVANKSDLLDGMVESLLTDFPLPDTGLAWQERLAVIGRAVRAVARRHPGVFPLLLRVPANTPAGLRARDAVCSALQDAGVPRDQIPRVERLLSTMILGFAASEAGGRFRGERAKEIDADFSYLEELVARVLQSRAATE